MAYMDLKKWKTTGDTDTNNTNIQQDTGMEFANVKYDILVIKTEERKSTEERESNEESIRTIGEN